MKTPKASGKTAHKSSGKPGRGRPSSRWSDWVWHKSRAWAATESLPYPTPPHQVGHLARGAAGGGDQNWGRARRQAPPAAPSGLGGCVLPGPGRTQGFRAEGSRPAQGRDSLGSTLSKRDRRRLPIPRRRVRRDLSTASRAGCLGSPLRVPSAFTGGGGGGRCCYCCCWPPPAAAHVPAPAPPPAAAAAASSPPLPSPLRRLLQRALTRPDVILPLRNPAQPSPPALPVRTPTSPPQVLIGERVTSSPRRLAGPIVYH